MAKRGKRGSKRGRRGGRRVNQRAKFRTAAKAALPTCIRKAGASGGSNAQVMKTYGSCLRTEMRARLR